MSAAAFQYSSTGFYKCPVSKGLIGCMFLTSCALNVPVLAHLKKYFIWSYADIFVKPEIWRLLISKAAFLDTKDLICGSLLLYYFRTFERRYGSRKYATCLLVTSLATTALELAVSVALHHLELNDYPFIYQCGPYSFIFPMFISYFFDIPRVAHTYILSIPVTGKTLTYLLGLQMASSSKPSIVSAVCGIVAGLMYKYNILWIRSKIRIPQLVSRCSDSTFGWLLRSSPPQEGATPMGATLEIQRQQQVEILEQQMLLNHASEMRSRANNIANQFQEQFGRSVDFGGEQHFANHNHYGMNDLESELRFRNVNEYNNQPQEDLANPGPSVREEQVQQLVDMGFDRQRVLDALRTSNYNVHIATNILLQDS